MLEYVPDWYKTQEMCKEAVREDPFSLEYVPDWFLTNGEVKLWHDDNDDDDGDDEVIEWYDGYQKRKA